MLLIPLVDFLDLLERLEIGELQLKLSGPRAPETLVVHHGDLTHARIPRQNLQKRRRILNKKFLYRARAKRTALRARGHYDATH